MLALLSLSACWPEPEEKTTIVEGIVVNSGTKEPIEGVLVSLLDGSGYASAPDNHSSGKANRVETDENGAFRVEITGIYHTSLAVGKRGYSWEHVIDGAVQGSRPFSEGLHENVVLEMDADAFFAPVLKSKESLKDDEMVSIEPSVYDDTKDFSRTGDIHECKGEILCLAFENRPYRGIGDKYLVYQLKYTRNATEFVLIDSVYIKSFETYRDTLSY